MSELLQSGQHPNADQLNAFVEHTLPPHELEQTLTHLAVCPDCREIVALSLPPVDELPPRLVHKPWFSGWNIAWPAVGAIAALVFIIVHIHNPATTRNSAGTPTQIAASNPPAPLQPPTTSQISTPKPPPQPQDRRQSIGHHPEAASGVGAIPTQADTKTSVGTRSLEAPIMQQGGLTVSSQPAPASGLSAMHGLMPPSVRSASSVGVAAVAPLQKAPPVPMDRLQQSPLNSRDAVSANASGGPLKIPFIAGASKQAQTTVPPPLAAPTAPVVNQTVDVAQSPSVIALSLGSSEILLNQATITLTHPLPSKLSALSIVSNSHQVIAIDTQNGLFFSDDDGNHWKAIPAQWHGRAIKVALASSMLPKKLSAGTLTGDSHSVATFGESLGPVTTQTPTTSSTLTGAVTDSSGAIIPNASVVVSNATTPNVRTVKTDRTGRYLVDNLTPGSYQVAAEAPGFNQQQLAITITASQPSSANLTLSVGQATETVTVNASSEPIATLSVVGRNSAARSSASQPSPVFEITTDTGEHWTSADGQIWKHQ